MHGCQGPCLTTRPQVKLSIAWHATTHHHLQKRRARCRNTTIDSMEDSRTNDQAVEQRQCKVRYGDTMAMEGRHSIGMECLCSTHTMLM
jgi:hypothetical protein